MGTAPPVASASDATALGSARRVQLRPPLSPLPVPPP
eukprot:CAMPEP_0180232610 /NCGR_PEP_ID=MMETSP0987-20121128/27572_1 /TAXON_ID=697907 /ORGANISM="non described non described, Strain CCMP2293" /LENGTH=36 /DNA_ID= /DNA_START= /DNA_END= /DNA_ORIENTATION=